jgi:hypothetical protein
MAAPSLIASGPSLLAFFACLAFLSCAPESSPSLLPQADLSPPALIAAGPLDESSFGLGFDEEVRPVENSFGLEAAASDGVSPRASAAATATVAGASAEGRELKLRFGSPLAPGGDYRLAGEVEDGHGNRTRFALSFVGYNSRPPRLRISELQTQKNASAKNPHRDFIELLALSDGDSGGVELSWMSTAKSMCQRLPSSPIHAGDYLVIHAAPEGLAGEVDELGGDLSLSSGVDSSASGRDFWSKAGGLPDATGIVVLRPRPGDGIEDGVFYVEEGKTGAIPSGRLADAVKELEESGLWKSQEGVSYEDGFAWKPSSSRSLYWSGGGGREGWHVTGSGGQSPGQSNPGGTGP